MKNKTQWFQIFSGLCVFFSIFFLGAVAGATTTVTTSGSGYASGMCDGHFGSFGCVDNLKQQARRDAVSRAELDCRIRSGNPVGSYTASCGFEYCNPSFFPADAPSQYVTCRSDCSVSCELKN